MEMIDLFKPLSFDIGKFYDECNIETYLLQKYIHKLVLHIIYTKENSHL